MIDSVYWDLKRYQKVKINIATTQNHSHDDRLNENSQRNNISFHRVHSWIRTLSWDSYLISVWSNSHELASHFFTKYSEKSWTHRLKIYEIHYFYSFNGAFWRFNGSFFTTSVCLWIMQQLIPISGMVLSTQAINLRCCQVINFTPSVQMSMHSSHDGPSSLRYKSTKLKISSPVVRVFRGLQNNSSTSF